MYVVWEKGGGPPGRPAVLPVQSHVLVSPAQGANDIIYTGKDVAEAPVRVRLRQQHFVPPMLSNAQMHTRNSEATCVP